MYNKLFMWKHVIIFQCTGGGMEIVKLPQAAQLANGGRGAGGRGGGHSPERNPVTIADVQQSFYTLYAETSPLCTTLLLTT